MWNTEEWFCWIKLFFSLSLKKNYCTFFQLPFSPLWLPPPQSPHSCLCPWVLFSFCSIPPPPKLFPLPFLSSCSPSMSLFLSWSLKHPVISFPSFLFRTPFPWDLYKHFPKEFFDSFTSHLRSWAIPPQFWLHSVALFACYSSQIVEDPSGENCISLLISCTTNVCFPISAGSSTLILNLFLICSWLFLPFPTAAVPKHHFSSQAPTSGLLTLSRGTTFSLLLKKATRWQFSPSSSSNAPVVIHSFSSLVSLNLISTLLTFSSSLQMCSSPNCFTKPFYWVMTGIQKAVHI